jgi:hypothetical protein
VVVEEVVVVGFVVVVVVMMMMMVWVQILDHNKIHPRRPHRHGRPPQLRQHAFHLHLHGFSVAHVIALLLYRVLLQS